MRYLCLAIQCGKWVHLFHVQKVWNDVLVQTMFATYIFGRFNTSKLTCIINGPFNPCYLPFRFGSFPRKDVPRPDFLKGVAGGW